MTEQSNELTRLQAKLAKKDQQITELLVVIDTAQAALRRVQSSDMPDESRKDILNQSARWVMKFSI